MRKAQSTAILAASMILTTALTGCRTDATNKQAETSAATGTDLGAETTSDTPKPPAIRQDAHDHRSLIVCFGDSLTAGYGADQGQSYPDYLQASLDAQGFPYRVINEGTSGNTTKDGVERLPSILALKPAVVVVEFGGNDGLRGLPIADSRANLDQIVRTLKASGTKVALAGITLPPNYGPDYIRQFDQTYTLLAKKYNVPLLPFLLRGVFGTEGMMQADQTHATAAGNKIVAQNVLPLITPLLKK